MNLDELTGITEDKKPKKDKTEAITFKDSTINKHAYKLAKNLINFEDNLWKREDNGSWINTTDEKSTVTFNYAVRRQVKEYLNELENNMNEGKPDDKKITIGIKNIDAIKRELLTILTGKKYSFEKIKPAMRFLDKTIWWNKSQGDLKVSDDVDFSPFQIKRKTPVKEVSRKEAHILTRFMENLTGGDRSKENAIYEWCGFVLAGEHSGVGLVINGASGIGKNTITKMLDVVISDDHKEKYTMDLDADDIYTTNGDKYAFANGVEKHIWVVGEGSNTFKEDAIKRFNKLVDETKTTFSVRKMYQNGAPSPKFWNLALLTNGGFSAYANSETMSAFKNRLLIIDSPAKKGILNKNAWYKMFSGDNITYFIQESIKGYLRIKENINFKRVDRFTKTDSGNFWNNQNDMLKVFDIIDNWAAVNEKFKNGMLKYISNREIERMIKGFSTNNNISKKYNKLAFKNELKTALDSGLCPNIEEIDKNFSGKEGKGLRIIWKEDK